MTLPELLIVHARAIVAAAEVMEIAPAVVMDTPKDRDAVDARHVAIWIVREVSGCSYTQLGKLFARDHTTCISACRRIEEAMRDGHSLRRVVRDVLATMERKAKAVVRARPEQEAAAE